MNKAKKGRKPVPDKKKIVALYVPESTLDKLDGVPGVQEIAYVAIEKRLKVKK